MVTWRRWQRMWGRVTVLFGLVLVLVFWPWPRRTKNEKISRAWVTKWDAPSVTGSMRPPKRKKTMNGHVNIFFFFFLSLAWNVDQFWKLHELWWMKQCGWIYIMVCCQSDLWQVEEYCRPSRGRGMWVVGRFKIKQDKSVRVGERNACSLRYMNWLVYIIIFHCNKENTEFISLGLICSPVNDNISAPRVCCSTFSNECFQNLSTVSHYIRTGSVMIKVGYNRPFCDVTSQGLLYLLISSLRGILSLRKLSVFSIVPRLQERQCNMIYRVTIL